MQDEPNPPAGFEPLFRTSPFLEKLLKTSVEQRFGGVVNPPVLYRCRFRQ